MLSLFKWQCVCQCYELLQNLCRSGTILYKLCQTTHSTKTIQRTPTMLRNISLLLQIANVWVRFGDYCWDISTVWPTYFDKVVFYLNGVTQNIIDIKLISNWSQFIDEGAKPLHNHIYIHHQFWNIFLTHTTKILV